MVLMRTSFCKSGFFNISIFLGEPVYSLKIPIQTFTLNLSRFCARLYSKGFRIIYLDIDGVSKKSRIPTFKGRFLPPLFPSRHSIPNCTAPDFTKVVSLLYTKINEITYSVRLTKRMFRNRKFCR